MSSDERSFWRALAAFVALPGTVALLGPWLLRPAGAPFHADGVPSLVVGGVILLWCVRDFYVTGRGTLAPWSPPRHLVTVGLYRWSRNPMYVGVLLVLCGWALGYRSTKLWIYTAAVGVAFHLRIVLGEEPWLARTFGSEWLAYVERVPRWLPWRRSAGHRRRATAG